jgi:hypothetical protein
MWIIIKTCANKYNYMRRGMNTKQLNLLARLVQNRQSKQQAQKEQANSRRIQIIGFVGGRLKGQDENGKRIDMKLIHHGWKWNVGFKRGARSKNVDGNDWIETDVFHAVRMFAHIAQTHLDELFDNERILTSINPMHSVLASGGKKTNQLLQRYISEIDAICDDLALKQSEHKIEGREKLSQIPPILEQAIAQPSKRGIRAGAASSKLPAFKRRYVENREAEIFGIDSYDQVRWGFLQTVRDKGMHELFNELAGLIDDNPIGMVNSIASDWEIIARMRVAQELVTKGKMDDALTQINLAQKATNVEWIQRGVERIKNVFEAMRKSGFNGWRADARAMMEDFARFIGQNNPKYVQIELAASNDKYLEKIRTHLNRANAWIRSSLKRKYYGHKKRDARRAASEFRQAVIALITADN